MKPGEVATFLQIGRSTVTHWTSGEFKPYFSPTAQGGAGIDRVLTDTDVRILYLLKQRKDAAISSDNIHRELQALRDKEWDGLPTLPDARPSAVVPVMPTAAADAALAGYLREIATLQERIEQLEAKAVKDQNDREKLLRELGELTAELRLYREGRIKPLE